MSEALIFYLKSRDKEAAANGDQGRTFAPGEDIVTEGSRPGYSILISKISLVATNRWPTLQTYYGIAGAARRRARSGYLPAHSSAGDEEPVRGAALSASAASLIARSRVVFASRAAR